jgi:probable HAF family extracellular repeat protein
VCCILLLTAIACGDENPSGDGPPTQPPPPFVPQVLSKIRIGTLPGHSQSLANGLNENGEVVGVSFGGEGVVRAFHWSEAAGMVDLGYGTAYDLSDFGDIVGWRERRAVLWDPVGAGWNLIELPPFEEPVRSGHYNDVARAIDRFGQFVAGSSSPDLGRRPDGTPLVGWIPVVWQRRAVGWDVVSLPTVDGTGPGTGTGIALDVNSAGVAVGLSPSFPPAPNMAVIRRPGSGGYSVESLPPVTAPESYALSIGEDGRVTGFVGEIDGARVGVVWTPLTSGWRVDTIGPDEAHGINESGFVVGEVSARRGPRRE